MTAVENLTAHHVVGEIRLRNQVVWVNCDLQTLKTKKHCYKALLSLYLSARVNTKYTSHLKDVVTRRNICDVNPLAINVSSVGVMASRTQTLQHIK